MRNYPILFNRKEECCGCGACFLSCKTKAIEMVLDDEGFEYPVIDKGKCVCCYLCLRVCSFKPDKV